MDNPTTSGENVGHGDAALRPACPPLTGAFTPIAFLLSLVRHRALIWNLTQRHVQAAYRGSVFGLLWTFFHPLFMLAVYTFVFSIVLQIRWGVQTGNRAQFALLIFSGLMVFNIVSACLTRSPTIMAAYPSYINKVVFPLEVIPVIALCEALFHALMSFFVFFAAATIILGEVPWTAVFFPVLLVPLLMALLGIMWVLASIGVFFRDLGQIMTVVATMLLFLSPVFYPLDMVPEKYKVVLFLNPFTPWLQQLRGILFWGEMPDPVYFAAFLLFGWIAAWIGFAWFMRVKKTFGDVI